jgi:signal transduction histidine kinase
MMRLRSLLPDGLAARFALLLAAALIVANLVALFALSTERNRLDRAAQTDREIARILALVPALEAVDPARRGQVAREASTRFARVTVDATPIVAQTADDARSRGIATQLGERLGERAVAAAVMRGHETAWHLPGRLRDGVAIAISLRTGEDRPLWLNVVASPPGDRPGDGAGDALLLIFGLSLLAVLGTGLLFLRRLTRPLAQLANAATAAGAGDRTIRLPETGPREMRAVAGAFNDMQVQIAAFDAERMRMLAAVGHDLRTPITSLRIRAEMLEDEARVPMVRTLDQMVVMADGLVAYAKNTTDAEPIQRIDLGSLLRDLCADRGAELAAGTVVDLQGRPVALTRGFGNLIDNAMRYAGTCRVGLEQVGKEVVVTVEDDGPGIPADQREAMFAPFARGDDSRNTDTGGAGLGLSIARTVFVAHGGTITLTDAPKGGLRAIVRLPLTAAKG